MLCWVTLLPISQAGLELILPLHTLRNLKTLEMSYVVEDDLPASWRGLANLTKLDLCYMTRPPNTLLALTNFQELSVSTEGFLGGTESAAPC